VGAEEQTIRAKSNGRAPEDLLNLVLEHAFNAVILTDREGRIEFVNSAFERITGWPRGEAVGRNMSILKSGETPKSVYEDLWRTIRSGRTWRGLLKNRRRDGSLYLAKNVITPVGDPGEVAHFLAIQEDITAHVQAEDSDRERAQMDPLTGVFSRVAFLERVDRLIEEAAPSGRIALYLLDLDEFAPLNQTWGLATGNRVLSRVGEILRRFCEERCARGCSVGYLGGDEFGMVRPVTDDSEGLQCANDLVRAVREGQSPDLPGWSTASVGWVLFPEHGRNSSQLLGRADVAVHIAKELGRDRAHRYLPEDHHAIRSRIQELQAIRDALRDGRFVPHFQPILDLRTLEIHHFEALARMIRPDGSIAPPGEFIETAERFQVVGEIDRAILSGAVQALMESARRGERVTISVNLSGRDVMDRSIQRDLRALVRQGGADPSRVIFEITETEAVRDLDRARRFILDLRAEGFRFALDDFGSGFASFRYLKELPVEYLKIDGAFIRHLEEDDRDQVFVQAIVQVARHCQITTIAEFVESPIAMKLLRAFGVDMAQGFAIGRPAPTLDRTVRVRV